MKTFFGGSFIDKNTLAESGIYHPIKLEYYKKTNEDKNLTTAKYGISIVKTEYRPEGIKVEEKQINCLTNDENKANKMLHILKENSVTPIGLEDVICDFSKQIL